MIVVLLSLAVALTLLEPLSFAPALPAWWAGPAVAAYLVLAAGIAAGSTAWTLRTSADGALLSRPALRRRRLMVLAGQVYLVGGLAGVLLAGYRTAILTSSVLIPVPGVAVLLAWAPFVAALLITWVLEYPLYRAVRLQSAAAAGFGCHGRARLDAAGVRALQPAPPPAVRGRAGGDDRLHGRRAAAVGGPARCRRRRRMASCWPVRWRARARSS